MQAEGSYQTEQILELSNEYVMSVEKCLLGKNLQCWCSYF